MLCSTVPLYNVYATIDLQADSLLISMLDNTYPQLWPHSILSEGSVQVFTTDTYVPK